MARPIGSFKHGTDQDKIARFEKRPINVYKSKFCSCQVKTRITLLDCFCTTHGHVLTLSK